MTKLLRLLSNRNLLALAALSVSLMPQTLRAQQIFCSTGTMRGTYVLSGTGTLYLPSGTGTGTIATPFAVVGKVTYDGNGKGQGIETISVGGTVYRQDTITGAYKINDDCTGSKSFTDATGVTSHFDFVVSPTGRTIVSIATDSGTVLTITATRLDFVD
jgi:hypothetical protein